VNDLADSQPQAPRLRSNLAQARSVARAAYLEPRVFAVSIFIAIVKRDGQAAYTASFPDFPGLAVEGPTLDRLLARAREVLGLHVERMVETNKAIGVPMPAHEVDRSDALLLAAVDIPDELATAHVDLEISALALARIDSFARRHGLTRSALFIQAVDHWALQEAVPRDRRSEGSDGPTLFDFVNPLELKVETQATEAYPLIDPIAGGHAGERAMAEVSIDDIAAELERLVEGSSGNKPNEATMQRSPQAEGE
jgi:predicted RNase H-like HicB family nuclease